MIEYKAREKGITVIIREESYTSIAFALDGDTVPDYGDKVLPKFSGKRVRRGLYKTKKGQLLNADINGALNILRKEFSDEDIPGDKGFLNNPILKTFHNEQSPKVFGIRKMATQQASIAA